MNLYHISTDIYPETATHPNAISICTNIAASSAHDALWYAIWDQFGFDNIIRSNYAASNDTPIRFALIDGSEWEGPPPVLFTHAPMDAYMRHINAPTLLEVPA